MENFENKIFGPASLGIEASYYNFEEKYIGDLDLSEEELKMKILDIGGGDGNFASKLGNNVVVVDSDAHNYFQHSSMVITAKAEQLPIVSETFELVISAQSMPFLYGVGLKSKEEIKSVTGNSNDPYSHAWAKEALNDSRESIEKKTRMFFGEVLRVLKKGGRGKFAPIPFLNGKWEAEYFEILKKILKEKESEGLMEFKFLPIPAYDFIPNDFEIYRLEITKK